MFILLSYLDTIYLSYLMFVWDEKKSYPDTFNPKLKNQPFRSQIKIDIQNVREHLLRSGILCSKNIVTDEFLHSNFSVNTYQSDKYLFVKLVEFFNENC